MISALRLGLIPMADESRGLLRAQGMAQALSDLIGTPVETHQAADYRVLLSAMDQGIVHFAWVPPLAAARGIDRGILQPAAVTVRNGTTSYMTALIALKSSRVQTLAELRGVRAAWVDRESASGYLVIRSALRNAGVSLVSAFSEEIFVRSHGEVAKAVHTGRVDVGATCFNFVSGTFEIARSGYRDEGGLSQDDIRILAHAGPIPSDVFAVHRSLPPSTLALLQTGLVDGRPLRVHETARELTHADGFVRPSQEHLAMLRDLLVSVDVRSVFPSVPPPKR